ncbi:protein-L-isoaspartate(D-aspartate) O-methyltransferase [Methanoregula sp.]|uniref:protein-L-isoaspartate(D-aspartate) O-methyltransferase n=1 Tax=Methanoregula sp. TaxID=2052170 RepID=UPI00236CC286|nr:protein-L-isoaspartate(D-aspartate) O-methyltransferase [Methanoregula sp.]MDD1687665.1 protein-L-isoaspartate(D-aspartate) O-methyltransferase [Methanoregula sp.]
MDTNPRAYERSRMVELQIRSRGISNPRILAAMRDIPRHLFIPPPYNTSAYEDAPLPIGNGQTISQPYIVALMTELLDPRPGDRVLEIGAGSGYQAAILSMLVQHVTTIERIPAVADLARANLAELGFNNVSVIVGDGTQGYPEDAPYDGIMITAATPEIPQPLIDQLADGGRLVAPVGGREIQELITLARKGDSMERSSHGGVRFVPLIGEFGWGNT